MKRLTMPRCATFMLQEGAKSLWLMDIPELLSLLETMKPHVAANYISLQARHVQTYLDSGVVVIAVVCSGPLNTLQRGFL